MNDSLKAVKITGQNRSNLGAQYNVDPDDFDDMLPLDYVILCAFSGEWYEGVITQATFDEFWEEGQALQNDYFIATKKVV